MHRMKIGLIAAIVLLGLTVGLYAVVTRELKESVVQDLDLAVSRAQRIHGDVARLEAMEFENLVGQHSHRAAVVGVFDKSSEDSRRQAALPTSLSLSKTEKPMLHRPAGSPLSSWYS